MPFTKNDPANDGPVDVWLVGRDTNKVEGGWAYFGPTPVPPGDQINIRDTMSGRTARALVTGYDPEETLPIADVLIMLD